jgi:hypothetical protein
MWVSAKKEPLGYHEKTRVAILDPLYDQSLPADHYLDHYGSLLLSGICAIEEDQPVVAAVECGLQKPAKISIRTLVFVVFAAKTAIKRACCWHFCRITFTGLHP